MTSKPRQGRRKALPRLGAVALLLCCVTTGAKAADPLAALRAFGLDLEQGDVDGQRALAVLPGWLEDGGAIERWLPPEGCTAHLVPWQNRLRGSEHPCGQWFLPPNDDRYDVWTEGPGWMSPHPARLAHVAGPFEGRGSLVASPVIPAGQVVIPSLPGGTELWAWLLRAETDRHFELLRLEPLREEGFAVQMPAGRVLVGLWDAQRRRFLALARPLEVAVGAAVRADFTRPEARGHVVARLELPAPAETEIELEIEAWLGNELGDQRPADVVVTRQYVAYAVWYDVPPGTLTVHAESRLLAFPTTPIEVAAGEITYLPGAMAPKPRLDVEVRLPAAVARQPLELVLRRFGDPQILDRTTLSADRLWTRFEAMPLDRIQVELRTELGAFARVEDLRDGADHHLVLEPDLIFLHGTVYYGDRPHPAEIELDTVTSAQINVSTDADGAYEVALLEPVRFIKVRLVDREVSPHVELWARGIETSRELDFHLSDVELRVHVLDAMTRKGIPRAAVAVKEAYDLEPDGESPRGRQSVAQRLETDASGTLILPPPRQGRIEVFASAEGYERATEPLTLEVTAATKPGDYDIMLAPRGPSATLGIRLPSGHPAAGAQVLVLEAGARELLSVRTDASGVARLPRAYAGRSVLVTHPQAAFLLREWRPPAEGATASWVLPPRAERPLRLEVLEPHGEEPARGARIALWIEGVFLEPKLLVLLTGAAPLTDALGTWTATNLPPSGVRAVAWREPGLESAGLEAVATEAAYPWPSPLQLRVIE